MDDKQVKGKIVGNTFRQSDVKKLYMVRDAKGRFKDIQTYQRLHRADLRRKERKSK